MSVNYNPSIQLLPHKVPAVPSYCCTPCIQEALTIFRQIAKSAQQETLSLANWAWKQLKDALVTIQKILFKIIGMTRRPVPLNISFGDNQILPADIFFNHLLPYLSAKDLYQLFLTRTEYSKLLKIPAVLNQLFSSPGINHSELASLLEEDDREKVTQLNLESSQLTEQEILTLMRQLPKLQSLKLNHSAITDAFIGEIKQGWPDLIHLNLFCSNISTPNLQKLVESKTNLVSLDISSHNPLKNASLLSLIQNCPNLTSLKCQTKNADLIAIAIAQKCKKLTCLHLEGRKLTNQGIIALAENCPNLTNLSFSDKSNQVTDEAWNALAKHCSKLTHLYLQNAQITDESLLRLIQNNPMLENLRLSECPQVTGKAFQDLTQSCPNLTYIDLTRCGHLSNDAFEALAKRCPNLRSICLSSSITLADEAFAALATHCPNLTTFMLLGSENITDLGLLALAEGCPMLASLFIVDCEKITGCAFQGLTGKFKNLRLLMIRKCENITYEGIQAIVNNCPHLKKLRLGSFKQITDQARQELFKERKDLDIFFIIN